MKHVFLETHKTLSKMTHKSGKNKFNCFKNKKKKKK